eukprot:TRINITY_DN22211_c0_g1_i3.p1 TRINITY_DN22211_c0_g1~~TRINITY_DN22211_c0_g1_i3.p1  ORF type:complete len:166 (-),score=37.65 TRINITY_DN22211_c0_g1_i3:110-607(-)
MMSDFFFFQAEDGIRDLVRSRGLGDVYKRQAVAGLKPGEIEQDECNAHYILRRMTDQGIVWSRLKQAPDMLAHNVKFPPIDLTKSVFCVIGLHQYQQHHKMFSGAIVLADKHTKHLFGDIFSPTATVFKHAAHKSQAQERKGLPAPRAFSTLPRAFTTLIRRVPK